MREAHLWEAEFKNDKWIDVLIYAILADECLQQNTSTSAVMKDGFVYKDSKGVLT